MFETKMRTKLSESMGGDNNGCNENIKYFPIQINVDRAQWNGNKDHFCQNQNDKINMLDNTQYSSFKTRPRNLTKTVQTRFINSPSFKLNFTFHRLLISAGILFIVICSIANGQELPRFQRKPDIFSIHKTHHVIQPMIFDGIEQRQILKSTRQTHGEHARHIILEYTHLDKRIIADLFLNTHLLTDGHFLSSQNANGTNDVKTFNRTNVDLCHYQGRIRNNLESKIALSTCDGINGLVYDGIETYFIHSNDVTALDEPHYLFSQSDIDPDHPVVMNSIYEETNPLVDDSTKKFKRSVTEMPIKEPYNANKQTSYVELVIVIDNEVYKELDQNLDKVHKYCKDIANIINSLYVPLNIFIALVGVVVWTEKNEIELSDNGDKTLTNFLNYRRKTLVKDHPNDNAQLLTKQQFEGGVVGKALKGPICTFEFSGGVSTDHSSIISVVATTIAHEMGHNFGMEHDSTDCKCPDDRCIMSASSSSIAPTHWSECSIDQLNFAIHQGMNHCLRNIPAKLFEGPTCGNGFVEMGEECDCGLPSVCKNSCCDPTTCKLRSNATCAAGRCCDLATCQPHEAGFECRASTGECDLPEYCNGESEFCPIDYFKRDTVECEGGKAYCYQGACRSRDDQCKLLWGPSGKSSEQCYEKNLDGSRHGNCGYDRIGNKYKNCSIGDVFCGMLQCRHLNERLEFGMESVAVLSHSFISHGGTIIPCRTAVIDLGIDTVDPGLAPDGSKCDVGKMCLKQSCVSIEKLREESKIKDCVDNCNGHGICDNIGHCHCDKGYAPPYCDQPGPGGSLHSGPASPDSGNAFVRIMYVFFLGVVPFIALSLFLLYYWQQNRPWFISQSPTNDLKVRHYPDRPAPQPPSAPLTQLPQNNMDDTNATLLKANIANGDAIKRELFGNFKGFSLKPLPMSKPNIVAASNVAYVHPVAKKPDTIDIQSEQCVPIRAAPLPPSNSPLKKQQLKSSPKPATQTIRYQNINAPAVPTPSPETPIEVKLFAAKNDAKERPKISHPVLENSTCSVKELIGSANSMQNIYANNDSKAKPTFVAPKPVESQAILKKSSADKGSLKNLEISAPVKSVTFGRSQSMRSPTEEKSQVKKNVLSSASMRKPGGVKRQMSVVDRPKNPPPPRPANPPKKALLPQEIYVNIGAALNGHSEDSLNDSTEDIYCVIDDIKDSADSSPANGLLSEIVNEIENRNSTSIYSTSKKTPSSNGQCDTEQTYQNLNEVEHLTTQPLIQKISEHQTSGINSNGISDLAKLNDKNAVNASHTNNVNSIAKKFNSTNALPGKPKPIIATKPTVPNSLTQKPIVNEKSSQNDLTKNSTATKANRWNSKPTINTTSSVRSLHKRFEN